MLFKFQNQEFTLPELLKTANLLVEKLGLIPPSPQVAEAITARTFHYYRELGLLAPPLGKKGTALVYGYLHLLQLLAIKALQCRFLPLHRIGEVLFGKGLQELEELVERLQPETEFAVPPPREPVQTFFQTQGPSRPWPSFRERRERLLQEIEPDFFPPPPAAPCKAGGQSATEKWRRFVLAPGFELHLREDQASRPSPEELDLIMQHLKNLVARFFPEK